MTTTAIAWAAAAFVLLGGFVVVVVWLRRRERATTYWQASRISELAASESDRGPRTKTRTIWPDGESVLPSLEDFESRSRERPRRVDIDLPEAEPALVALLARPPRTSASPPLAPTSRQAVAKAKGTALVRAVNAPADATPTPVAVTATAPQRQALLALGAATEAQWSTATALELTTLQLATLSAALAFGQGHAPAPDTVLVLRFPPTRMLGIARAELTAIRGITAPPAASAAPATLDAKGATAVASTLLAVLATQRHLEPVRAQWHELRATLAALTSRAEESPTVDYLKRAVQDLARFAREARDNPAWALATPGLRGRVATAVDVGVQRWHELQAGADALRQRVEAMAAARFGDRELVDALPPLRELSERRGEAEVIAALLAGLQRLRLGLGDAVPRKTFDSLQSIAAALRIGDERDAQVVEQLQQGIGSARSDYYVGKAVLAEQRQQLLATLEALRARASDLQTEFLAATTQAAHEGFPLADGGDDVWLLRLDGTHRVSAVRRAVAA